MNSFKFGGFQRAHKLGDTNCPACKWDVPQPCDKCEEGLIHIELNNKNVGTIFLLHCDVCAGKGKNWKTNNKPKYN